MEDFGYYELKFKLRPDSKDYDIDFKITQKDIDKIRAALKHEDYETYWVTEGKGFLREWEIRLLYSHLEATKNYVKRAPWWADTEIEHNYYSQSTFLLNDLTASYIYEEITNHRYEIDYETTTKNIEQGNLEIEYLLSLQNPKGVSFKLKLSQRSMEEFKKAHNKTPERVSEIEEELAALREFAKENDINLRLQETVQESQEENDDDKYDKPYIDLE